MRDFTAHISHNFTYLFHSIWWCEKEDIISHGFHMVISHYFSQMCEIVCERPNENFTCTSHVLHMHFTSFLPVVNPDIRTLVKRVIIFLVTAEQKSCTFVWVELIWIVHMNKDTNNYCYMPLYSLMILQKKLQARLSKFMHAKVDGST